VLPDPAADQAVATVGRVAYLSGSSAGPRDTAVASIVAVSLR
jgi:hypothetical protein